MSPSHFHGMYSDPMFLLGLFPVSPYRSIPLSMVEVKFSLSTPCRHIGEIHSSLILALDESEWLTSRPALLSPSKEPRDRLCEPQSRSGTSKLHIFSSPCGSRTYQFKFVIRLMSCKRRRTLVEEKTLLCEHYKLSVFVAPTFVVADILTR